jgi:hypothetical protein
VRTINESNIDEYVIGRYNYEPTNNQPDVYLVDDAYDVINQEDNDNLLKKCYESAKEKGPSNVLYLRTSDRFSTDEPDFVQLSNELKYLFGDLNIFPSIKFMYGRKGDMMLIAYISTNSMLPNKYNKLNHLR